MELDHARNYVDQLLTKADIKAVYYIDDYLSYDGLKAIASFIEEQPIDVLQALIPTLDEKVLYAKQASVSDLPVYISTWWESLNDTEQDYVLKCCDCQSKGLSEENLKSILGKKCVFCTPEKWESQFSRECLAFIQRGEKVLLLFDFKLGMFSTDGEGRNGISLANSFKSNPSVPVNSFCGIFSQEFSIEKEFSFRKEHQDLLDSWAFPLSKSRLSTGTDFSLFVEGLKNVLWVNDVDSLNNISASIIESVAEQMKKAFTSINPPEFKQLVINSSLVEGCREIDSLLRLIHIVFDKQIRESLAQSPDKLDTIFDSIERIVEIDSVARKETKHIFEKSIVNSFFQDESYIHGTIINGFLTPLQNGDLFCVNDKAYYVLLCQPCNLAIRSKGRRSNDYDIGFLVPLFDREDDDVIDSQLRRVRASEEDIAEETISIVKKELRGFFSNYQSSYSPINCSIDGKRMFAAINKYSTISLSLLDYATFSEDGKVIINKTPSLRLHRNQKQLAKNHLSKFEKMGDYESMLDGLDQECAITLKPKIKSLAFSLLLKLGIKPNYENSQFVFPIQRIGHLREPYSSDLLIQLSHYISRTGFPGDFGKE